MKLANLKSFPENRIKSLFGLAPQVLAEVVIKVLPVLEQNREERLRNSPDRKRRYVKNDGRPAEIKPIDKLLMTRALSAPQCFGNGRRTNVRF